MLGQKPGKDSMFIENTPHGAEPIIPIFHRSNIPIVTDPSSAVGSLRRVEAN